MHTASGCIKMAIFGICRAIINYLLSKVKYLLISIIHHARINMNKQGGKYEKNNHFIISITVGCM